MDKAFIALGSISAFVGVALGAFAAHALKAKWAADVLAVFEVGVRYQMYHAFALIAAGFAYARWPGPIVTAAGWLFLLGTLLFSGSLYALAATGMRAFGAITPFGGLAFLAGWVCLAWSAWRA